MFCFSLKYYTLDMSKTKETFTRKELDDYAREAKSIQKQYDKSVFDAQKEKTVLTVFIVAIVLFLIIGLVYYVKSENKKSPYQRCTEHESDTADYTYDCTLLLSK